MGAKLSIEKFQIFPAFILCLVFNLDENFDHYFRIYWRTYVWEAKKFPQQVNIVEEDFLVCEILLLLISSEWDLEKVSTRSFPLRALERYCWMDRDH